MVFGRYGCVFRVAVLLAALSVDVANGQFGGQTAPLSPTITWNDGSYLPIRAEIKVDEDDLVARGVQFGDVRIVYSYRHADF